MTQMWIPPWLGRRGCLLVMLGLIFAIYGASIFTSPTGPFGGFTPLGLPTRPWGWLWIGCGAVAVAAAALRWRWPAWDVAGWSALYVPPALWAVVSVWSWLAWIAGFEDSNGRGWVTAVIWLALIVIVLVVSGWPEPLLERRPRR